MLTEFNSAGKIICSDGKESVCNVQDPGSIPGLGRSLGEGNGNPLQYSCREKPMNGGALQATVHGVTKSHTFLSDFTLLTEFRGKKSTGSSQLMQKRHLTISIPFHDEKFIRFIKKEKLFNILKAIYEKSLNKIKFNDEILKWFSLKSGTRQGCPILLLSFNIELGVVARAERQEKEVKGLQLG